MELQRLPISDLVALYAHVMEELRRRGVTRSSNNPVADYAEYLCEKALSLTRTEKSAKGFDATDSAGTRYQIKGRRLTAYNASRQLGVLRELEDNPFDYLAGVLFREDFTRVESLFGTHHRGPRTLRVHRSHQFLEISPPRQRMELTGCRRHWCAGRSGTE